MKLRSALFNTLFWVWIAVLGLTGLPFSLLWRPFTFIVARAWARGTLCMLRLLCGITYEIRGREHIPAGAAIIASKHQSAWDTVIFWILFKRPAFVLKRELIFLPVFGWYLVLLRNIYIDRKSGASALKRMLRQGRQRAAENRPIILFPEGTRTAPGAPSAYQPGIAALYQNLNVPVVPVALNSGALWPRNAFVKKPGVVVLEFLPAIPSGLRGREFLATLQERIETKTAELLKNTPSFSPAARP